MATARQQEQFEAELVRVLERTLTMDDQAVRDVFKILRQARARVAEAILNAEGFDQFHLLRIQRAIEDTFREFARQMDGVIDSKVLDAFTAGVSIIDNPFIAAGADVQVSAMPLVSPQVINAQIQRNTRFITNLSVEAANKINSEILLGITGEQSPNQVMKRIGNVLTDKSTFKTIADRAEAITRTEINAALNMGTVTRLEQAAELIGGLKKFWIDDRFGSRPRPEHIRQGNKTNPGFGGKAIPVKRDFVLRGTLGSEKAKGPHDPRLSAGNTVNCKCRLGSLITEETPIEELGRVTV